MAKFYETEELAIADVTKHIKSIRNAVVKNKYTKATEYVTIDGDNMTINCVGCYDGYKILVEAGNVSLQLAWWEKPVSVNDFNIGALRGLVDCLTAFKKSMKTNFELNYFQK